MLSSADCLCESTASLSASCAAPGRTSTCASQGGLVAAEPTGSRISSPSATRAPLLPRSPASSSSGPETWVRPATASRSPSSRYVCRDPAAQARASSKSPRHRLSSPRASWRCSPPSPGFRATRQASLRSVRSLPVRRSRARKAGSCKDPSTMRASSWCRSARARVHEPRLGGLGGGGEAASQSVHERRFDATPAPRPSSCRELFEDSIASSAVSSSSPSPFSAGHVRCAAPTARSARDHARCRSPVAFGSLDQPVEQRLRASPASPTDHRACSAPAQSSRAGSCSESSATARSSRFTAAGMSSRANARRPAPPSSSAGRRPSSRARSSRGPSCAR